MLILLEQNLVDGLIAPTDSEVSHLEDLLFYHSKFYHYVAASKRTALTLAENLSNKLSQRGIQTLKAISTQSNDLSNLLRRMQFYAVVRYSELAGCVTEENGGQAKWICDLEFAAKWFSQRSTIIGEHLTDTKIFKASGWNYAASNAIDGKMQRFKSEMSGGSGNAPAVMENCIIDAAGPVLCFLDSDKLSKNSDPSDSVKKCHAVLGAMHGVAYFFPFEERELENLIPTALIDGAIFRLPVSPDRDKIIERSILLKSLRDNNPDIYSYVDIKEGTCKKWATKHNVSDFFSTVPVVAHCSCHADCDGYFSPPIFKDVLNKASDFVEHQSTKQLYEALKGEQSPSWVGLGRTVLSFSLSNSLRTM
jgi:hypothetical protein